MQKLIYQYEHIMCNEAALRAAKTKKHSDRFFSIEDSSQMFNIALQIREVTKNSTVIRSGNLTAHLTEDKIAYESDGAHTNLVRTLVKFALDSKYGWNASPPHYDRGEIDEAIMLHDLPENISGDIPDNRNRDEAKKLQSELDYYNGFLAKYGPSHRFHAWKVKQLLREMNDRSCIEGRVLYVADKLSAILMMLCYDELKLCPRVDPADEAFAKISQTELKLCTRQPDGKILLSELWTVDFLYGREIVQYDETGFFLAILVITTLLTHGKWYKWRNIQYLR